MSWRVEGSELPFPRRSPSEPLLAPVNDYVEAMRSTPFRSKENVENPNEKGVLGRVHEELYKRLREEFNLPSEVAEDCYRDALRPEL
ncbi:hypothetical protein HS1genome_1196 [Sulfodiicoccus acidiphilus]|uniref:Uncharacterized protein n=1 Tax=Sulfodiicoccus acidiphilus TaxID=1670455 RepID=A0A348B3Q5_9CREN|nr:hypothetical protein HS1genome_1196 [Sulfodiicoccus acidiphilus]GGU04331.1 hypothetical protein GCM10007116_21280 [Sulfodiicoccus acidiphilus]